jgi:hypothetical protein
MRETDSKDERLAGATADPGGQNSRPDQVVEEEEKVLAGRLDANMPALLTKDVLGG